MMGLVSLLVLASGAAMLLFIFPGQNTQAAQSSAVSTAPPPNADVQKLLLIINEKKSKLSLKGVRNIKFKIDQRGKATDIVIVAKPSTATKNIEQRIRAAAFAPQAGTLRERKIQLSFKG